MKLSKSLLRSYLEAMGVNRLSIEGIRSNGTVFFVSLWKEHYLLDEHHRLNRFPKIIEVLNRVFDASEIEPLKAGCFAFKVNKESKEKTIDADDLIELFARLKRIGFILNPELVHDDGYRLVLGAELGGDVILPVDARQRLMKEFLEYVESKGYQCEARYIHRGPICSCLVSNERIKAERFDLRPSWYRFEITYAPRRNGYTGTGIFPK